MASATEPNVEMRCANCSKPTALTCSRCRAATYCGAVCQKAHWCEHKKMCNTISLDQTVHRAGTLLQKLVLIWCEQAQTKNISAIEDTGTRLVLHQGRCRPDEFYPFPGHLVKDEAQKQMVLTVSMCSEFLAYYPDIVSQMLRGTSVKIDEITMHLKEPIKMALIVAGSFKSDRPHNPHNVFRVTSADATKQWYLDATGAQFNIFTTCDEVDDYMKRCGDRVTNIQPFGTARKLYEELCDLPGLGGIHHRQRRDSVRAVQKGIDKWKSETGLSLPALLRLPKEKLATAERELLDTVCKSVKNFTILWDRKAEVDELMRKPLDAHLRDHAEGMRIFAKYDQLSYGVGQVE